MEYTSDFNANVAYSPSDVNAIRQSIATAGVIPETETSMKVTAIGGGKVRILEGQAIFASGARIAIDNEGVELTVIGTGKNYVYVKREQNSSEPYITTTAPTGDYVLLAEVTGQTVTDKRQYSAFKVTRGLGNGYFVKKNEDSISFAMPANNAWALYKTIEADSAEYNFAYISPNSENLDNIVSGAFLDFGNNVVYAFVAYGTGTTVNARTVGPIDEGFEYLRSSSSDRQFIKVVYSGKTIEFWGRNTGIYDRNINFNLFLL